MRQQATAADDVMGEIIPSPYHKEVPVPEDREGRLRVLGETEERVRANARFIDKDERRRKGFLAGCQIGFDALWVEKHELYRLHDFDSFAAYCQKRWRLGYKQVEKYMAAARAFGRERLAGEAALRAGIGRLAVAAKGQDEAVREVLFELASEKAPVEALVAGVAAGENSAGLAEPERRVWVREAVYKAIADAEARKLEQEELKQRNEELEQRNQALEKENQALKRAQREEEERRTTERRGPAGAVEELIPDSGDPIRNEDHNPEPPPPAPPTRQDVLLQGAAATRQLLANLERSQVRMGGEYIPESRGIIALAESDDMRINGTCILCKMTAAPGETDPDRLHEPACRFYGGTRPHIHDETCYNNPLCRPFYRPPPPPEEKPERRIRLSLNRNR